MSTTKTRLANALSRTRASTMSALATHESSGNLDRMSATRERRASRTIREFATKTRDQMSRFKSSLRTLATFTLVTTIVSGVLQASWHMLLASILVEDTGIGRSWNLVAPPLVGSVARPILAQ